MHAFGLLLLYRTEDWYRIDKSCFSVSGVPSASLLLRCPAKYGIHQFAMFSLSIAESSKSHRMLTSLSSPATLPHWCLFVPSYISWCFLMLPFLSSPQQRSWNSMRDKKSRSLGIPIYSVFKRLNSLSSSRLYV